MVATDRNNPFWICHYQDSNPECNDIKYPMTQNHRKTRMALGRVHTFSRLNTLCFVSHRWGRIYIRTLTKIKSACSCHLPNWSPSLVWIRPQLFEISCYITFLALSLNGEESLKNFSDPHPDPDLHQNRINASLSYTQPIHHVWSESVNNFLRYPAHRQTNKQEKDVVQSMILAKSTPSPKVAMDTSNYPFH